MLTQEILKEYFRYDPETGHMFWIKAPGFNQPQRDGTIAGTITGKGKGYVQIRFDGKFYPAHRLIWMYVHGKFPEHMIDHINGVMFDNRLVNLREATCSQNLMNKGKSPNNTSGFKGVSRHGDMWQAQCKANRKYYHLGFFNTKEEAFEKYKEFASKVHGEFFNSGERNAL
jgi:hypothetical protein